MPTIPPVFATQNHDETQLDQSYVSPDTPDQEVLMARHGGFRGGHRDYHGNPRYYRGYHYRHGYGHRPFGCWAPVPPPPF
jgi:hypothetical protein